MERICEEYERSKYAVEMMEEVNKELENLVETEEEERISPYKVKFYFFFKTDKNT